MLTFALFLLVHHQSSCLIKIIFGQSSSANFNELSVDNSPQPSCHMKIRLVGIIKICFHWLYNPLIVGACFYSLFSADELLQVHTYKDGICIIHFLVMYTGYFLPVLQVIFNLAYLYTTGCLTTTQFSHHYLNWQYCKRVLCVRHLV